MDSRPIFVAEHAWRGHAVKAAIAATALLLLAWLVAIVIGALGFGSLPGVPLTGDDAGGGAKSTLGSQPKRAEPATVESASSLAPASGVGAGQGSTGGAVNGAQNHVSTGTGGSANSGSANATPPQAGSTIPGSSKSNGQGRGAPVTKPTGGRGAPDVNPTGKVPGANAGGSNPNAGGANAGGGRNPND
jgi:hypothetical protein